MDLDEDSMTITGEYDRGEREEAMSLVNPDPSKTFDADLEAAWKRRQELDEAKTVIKPSKEAIDAASRLVVPSIASVGEALEDAYLVVIDVAPLLQRIRDLESGVASGVEPVVSENEMLHRQNEQLQQRIQRLEEFVPTSEQINILPEGIRRFIMLLETRCDPAGEVRSNVCLRDTVEALEQRIKELEDIIKQGAQAAATRLSDAISQNECIEKLEAELREYDGWAPDQFLRYQEEHRKLQQHHLEVDTENHQLKAERDALYESRQIWIKVEEEMARILGYDNSDGFHSTPDCFELAEDLKAERDRLKILAESNGKAWAHGEQMYLQTKTLLQIVKDERDRLKEQVYSLLNREPEIIERTTEAYYDDEGKYRLRAKTDIK